MNNRLTPPLPLLKRSDQPPQPAFDALRDQAEKQISAGIAGIEAYIKQHPATGIGAAFCIGILLGWLIKRR
jgi:ElaB/YqjD/DUF883 family membrane-anchored ribosome-binding protein